jgi:FHA domain
MWGQAVLDVIYLVGIVTWAVELSWLYREATTEGKDPISVASGAAVFFVLAVPAAIFRPDLIDRLAGFWERILPLDRIQPIRPEPTARLIVGGKMFPLAQDHIRIGRYPNNELVLDHPTIAAYHAEIQLRPDGRHEVVDRNSRNGTRVNGSLIRTAILRDGDHITVGALSLHYLKSSSVQQALQTGKIPADGRRAS